MNKLKSRHMQTEYMRHLNRFKQVITVLFSIFCWLLISSYASFAYAEVIKADKTTSFGTGFLITAEGHILTSWHVIKNKSQIYVGPVTGNKWKKATVIKVDEKSDLALLKTTPIARSPLEFAEWADVPIGLEAYSIGFPIPKVLGLSRKMTQGLVNGDRTESGDEGFFQFSAETQKGNSGGPVFAPDGSVIGVVQRKLDALKVAERSNDLPENVNYAVKSAAVIKFLSGASVNVAVRKLNLNTNMRPYALFKAKNEAVLAILAKGELENKLDLTVPEVVE